MSAEKVKLPITMFLSTASPIFGMQIDIMLAENVHG